MLDRSFLRWPFFEERHRALVSGLETWAAQHCAHVDQGDVDAACRDLVRKLGRDGWLRHTAPGDDRSENIDVRTLALIRETLARHSGLADAIIAAVDAGDVGGDGRYIDDDAAKISSDPFLLFLFDHPLRD